VGDSKDKGGEPRRAKGEAKAVMKKVEKSEVLTHNSKITTDRSRRRGERVGGAEDGTTCLDDVTAFPDHGAYRTTGHVCDKDLC